jgi:hypothetical protein
VNLPAGRAFAAGLGHGDGIERFFEFGFGQDLPFAADLADGLASLGAFFGDLRGFVVADDRGEAGD